LKGCAGYEDCNCFGQYWNHRDIYLIQEDMRRARILLLDAMRVLSRDKSDEADVLFKKIDAYLYPPNAKDQRAEGSAGSTC
jgi:hypothetical protein